MSTGNPNTSERAWSDEVALARAKGNPDQLNSVLDQREVAYEFSNGRKFVRSEPTYSVPA